MYVDMVQVSYQNSTGKYLNKWLGPSAPLCTHSEK